MPLEGAVQDYFPSAKVRLAIRFDEFRDGKSVSDQAPKKPSKNTNGVKDERSPLLPVKEEDDAGNTRFRLATRQAQQKTKGVSAEAQNKSADGFTHSIVGVIPKEAEWKQNGIRSPDSLSLTIKWTDMPIDPRVIRACGVDFYIGTVSAEEFAAGIAGQTRASDTLGSVEPMHVVPDSRSVGGKSRTNLRFRGYVDKWSVTWNDNEPLLKLECVDNTRLLMDDEAPPNLNLSASQQDMGIDEAVAQYLSHFPQFEDMTVRYVGPRTGPGSFGRFAGVALGEGKAPSLNAALGSTAYRPNLGPPPSKAGAGEEKTTVWDYLTDVCGAIGHIIRVDNTEIIIQKPTTLLNSDPQPREDDPYRTRKLQSRDYPVRAFIFGQNIAELSAEKQFVSNKTKNVEVRSYDPDRKTTLVARAPRNPAKRQVDANPGDGKTDQKWRVFKVAGIKSQDVLQDIADGLYNTRGRTEIKFAIKTKNLSSFGGGNADADLFDLKVGDAVEILVDQDAFSTPSDVTKQLTSRALNKQHMEGLGYQPSFAAAYAKAYEEAQLLKIYIVKEITCHWSCDEGVAFDLSAINFVVTRSDKANEETAPAKPPNAPSGQPKKNFKAPGAR